MAVGLQIIEECKAKLLIIVVFLVSLSSSTVPPRHASQPCITSAPPIVFARVASSLCPTLRLAHVLLLCPSRHPYPWLQQYAPLVHRGSGLSFEYSFFFHSLFAVSVGCPPGVVASMLSFFWRLLICSCIRLVWPVSFSLVAIRVALEMW